MPFLVIPKTRKGTMDPNVAINELLALVSKFELEDGMACEPRDEIAFEIVEKFKSLDSWLSSGGFPPERWNDRARPQ